MQMEVMEIRRDCRETKRQSNFKLILFYFFKELFKITLGAVKDRIETVANKLNDRVDFYKFKRLTCSRHS